MQKKIVVVIVSISLISILMTVVLTHFMPYSQTSNNYSSNDANNKANIYESIKAPSKSHDSVSTISFLSYRDPIYGIKILYPSNWMKIQFAKNFIAGFVSMSTSDSGVLENVMIANARLDYPISLDQLGNARISLDRSNYPSFHLVSSGQTTTSAGTPLYRIEFTHNIGALSVTTLEIWAISGNSAFMVLSTLDSSEFSNYMPIIQKMIDSFGTTAATSHELKTHNV